MSVPLRQLENWADTQNVRTILFTNGDATLSLPLQQLLKQRIRSLAALLAEQGADAEVTGQKLEEMDECILTREQLSSIRMVVRITPVFDAESPSGVKVGMWLVKGDEELEVTKRMSGTVICLYMQEENEEAAVAYTEENGETISLESLRRSLPEEDSAQLAMYTITFAENGKIDVQSTDSESLKAYQISGLCAEIRDTGVYRIAG